jgi:hypothetical protein
MAFGDEKETLARAWGGHGGPSERHSVPSDGFEEMSWADFYFFNVGEFPIKPITTNVVLAAFFILRTSYTSKGLVERDEQGVTPVHTLIII